SRLVLATGKAPTPQARCRAYPPRSLRARIFRCHHNPATAPPHSRPNRDRQWRWDKNQEQGMGMTATDNAASEREEIAARVAFFKATQEKFERERAECRNPETHHRDRAVLVVANTDHLHRRPGLRAGTHSHRKRLLRESPR